MLRVRKLNIDYLYGILKTIFFINSHFLGGAYISEQKATGLSIPEGFLETCGQVHSGHVL